MVMQPQVYPPAAVTYEEPVQQPVLITEPAPYVPPPVNPAPKNTHLKLIAVIGGVICLGIIAVVIWAIVNAAHQATHATCTISGTYIIFQNANTRREVEQVCREPLIKEMKRHCPNWTSSSSRNARCFVKGSEYSFWDDSDNGYIAVLDSFKHNVRFTEAFNRLSYTYSSDWVSGSITIHSVDDPVHCHFRNDHSGLYLPSTSVNEDNVIVQYPSTGSDNPTYPGHSSLPKKWIISDAAKRRCGLRQVIRFTYSKTR